MGLSLTDQRDILLFVVENRRKQEILREVATVNEFDERPGSGISFQIDIENAIGLSQQIAEI